MDYEPPVQFRSIILNTVEKLVRAADSKFDEQDGWESIKTKNNVVMAKKKSQKVKGERLVHTVRGKGLVRCDAETFRNLVIDLGVRRSKWDPVFAQGKVVELVDDKTTIVWMELKTKKCVMDFHRDLLYMQHSRKLADGTFIVASRSAGVLQDNSIVPVPEGAIRATLHTSGYVIRPLNDALGNCEVTYVVQCDVGGPMPEMLMNKIAEDQPQCIHRQRLFYAEMFGGGNDRIVHLENSSSVMAASDEADDEMERPSSGYTQDEIDQALMKMSGDGLAKSSGSAGAIPKSPKLRIGGMRSADASSTPVSPRSLMLRQSSAPIASVSRPTGSPRSHSQRVGGDKEEEKEPPSPRHVSDALLPSPRNRPLPSPRGQAPLPPVSPQSSPRGSPRASPIPPPRRDFVK